jgi:membrane protease YdiL (CAAX protease family)
MEVERQAPRWGLGDAAAGWVGGTLVGALVVGLWTGVADNNRITLGLQAAAQAALWAGLVGAPIWASRRKGSGSLREDFGLEVQRTDAALGIPVGLFSQLVLVPLIFIPLQQFVSKKEFERPLRQVTGSAHGAGFIVLAVLLVVAAPAIEELFYRGLVLRSLQRRFGDVWAVIGSALVFGLSHFELYQLPALVVFGVILGVLAVRTGRLGPSIWAHGVFNLIAVLAVALSR